MLITKNQTIEISHNNDYTAMDRIKLNKLLSGSNIASCDVGAYHINVIEDK